MKFQRQIETYIWKYYKRNQYIFELGEKTVT
jgi:hypothetical protein